MHSQRYHAKEVRRHLSQLREPLLTDEIDDAQAAAELAADLDEQRTEMRETLSRIQELSNE